MLEPIQIGIDPGISGALAVLHPNRQIEFYDTPTVQIRSGKKIKNTMDTYAIVTILQGITSQRDVMVTIEKVNAMPGMGAGGERQSMGATSAFNFGMGFGIWLGILAALRLPHQQVHPRTWKMAVMSDMGKDKDASRIKAMQLYPESVPSLTLKKHHGRADALLLAEWGRRMYSPGMMEKKEEEFALTSEREPF
jgi:hypothetical protein